MVKKEVRIIAWDDCTFKFHSRKVRVVGAIFRGGDYLDGMLSTVIVKDGSDSTEKISSCILGSRHYDQISCILTNGISFGGLNILDINELSKVTRMPVIAVVRKEPNFAEFTRALEKFSDGLSRKEIVNKTGAAVQYKEIFFQFAGIDRKQCEEILDLTCTRSNIPEPLRVVHLIASGLSRKSASGYESKGRA
jgi:uncharacterized protein